MPALCIACRYWYQTGMEAVYLKELASFAAFQNHLKATLGIDMAALHWTPLSITKQAGVNTIGISSPDSAMLYLSAKGSVCEKAAPSHAAFALEFLVTDGTWLVSWISPATGLPLVPSFKVTAKDGLGITGLQTPQLQPDAVLVVQAIT